MSAKQQEIAKSFFNLINKSRSSVHHAKWIHLGFWAHLLRREGTKIKAAKLLSALSKCGFIGVALDIDESTKELYGCVLRINQAQMRLKRRKSSISAEPGKTPSKERFFLWVVTAKYLLRDDPRKKEGERDHLESQYKKYKMLMKGSSPVQIEENTEAAVSATASLVVDTATSVSNAPVPRTITPTPISQLDLDINSDIKTFFGNIKGVHITIDNDKAAGELRKKMETSALDMAEKQITKRYRKEELLAASNSDNAGIKMLNGTFDIPLKLKAIQDINLAVTQLAEEHPTILRLPKRGGRGKDGKQLIPISQHSTRKSLLAGAKQLIPNVLDAVIDNEAGLQREDVIFALTKSLLHLDEETFLKACQSEAVAKLPKMTVERQKAMMINCGFSKKSFRLFRRYAKVKMGGHNMFQPESKVQAINSPVFPPTRVEFVEHKRKKTSFYRPVDGLFRFHLDRDLNSEASVLTINAHTDVKQFHHAHLVCGGDHGQKAFRFIVDLLIYDKGGIHKHNLVVNKDDLVGFIQCKKDIYEVLKGTIANPLNESFKRCKGGLYFLQKEGRRFVEFGNDKAMAALHSGANIIHHIPVELFMIDDLAFQLISQGRDGFSTWWCAFCQWGKGDWKNLTDDDHVKIGPAWTLDNYRELLTKIKPKLEQKKTVKSYLRKGVTEEPLFDAIPLENYLPPVLHSIDLFVNSVKKMLDLFVDVWLENRPIQVTNARWEEADKTIAFRAANQVLKDAEVTVVELRDSEASENTIEAAKIEVFEAEAALKKAKAEKKAATKTLNTLLKKKEHGAKSQSLWQAIDQKLHEQFHILRSAYHGHDMEGNYCRKVMRFATEVMAAIKDLLLETPLSQRAPGCDNREIIEYCDAFELLFKYMSVLSHFAYQPTHSITDSEMLLIREVVARMDRLWRKISKNMPPKVHAWHHIVIALERLRSMKYHQESKIEVAHQIGRALDLQFRAMSGDINKKIACMIQLLANMEDPEVKSEHSFVVEETKRQFSEETLARKEEKKTARKRAKDVDINDVVAIPEIKTEFKSMKQLTVDDRLVGALDSNVAD